VRISELHVDDGVARLTIGRRVRGVQRQQILAVGSRFRSGCRLNT
jgi:hypothetical protein